MREAGDQPMMKRGPQADGVDPSAPALVETPGPVRTLEESARVTRIATEEGFAVFREWGEGKPLVLVHGGGGSWTHFLHQIDVFARDHRIIAVDLPGFGDSSEGASGADPEAMARIVASGIEHLIGQERFPLAAFSFGSIVAAYVARLLRPQVEGLVLIGAVGMGLRWHLVDLIRWRAIEDPEARRAAHRSNLATLMIADPSRIDDLAILVQEANAERSRFNTRPVARTEPLSDAIDGIDVPLAAIWGERDQLAAPFFEERRDWIKGLDPDAPFVIVPDAGHWVQYEAPDAFNAALRHCLDSFERRN